jgi:II/X family phage/plasmid replication protein
MIDWQRKLYDVLHNPIPTGRILSIDHDGTMEWESPKSIQVRGSYESSIKIRSQGGDGQGRATQLYIDGNPSKFIQGHNVFGIEDNCALAEEMLRKICFYYKDLPSDFLIHKARNGEFEQLGIHIARSFDAGTRARAHAIQETLLLKSRTRSGRAQSQAGTNYWNKSARKRRWLCKSYLKGEELASRKKCHALPEELKNQGLEAYADALLRIEFEIYKEEFLDRHCPLIYGHQFTETVLDNLYSEYWSRIDMSTQANISSVELNLMPRALKSTYLQWREGLQVRASMSKTSFYHHRSELLKMGVDIAIPLEEKTSNVIPLIQIIEAKPVGIPEWAFDKNLVFVPKR